MEETNVMRISKRPSPVQVMVDPKHLENVEYLFSVITNDVRHTREIKCRIAMAQASFNKRKVGFTSKLDFNFSNETVKYYIWSIALYGAETWTLESRPLISENFWNVVLEKDGENRLD